MSHSYAPSGKTGNAAWLCWLWVSITLLPLTGAVYAFILWWMPFTFLNPAITILFSICLSIIHNLFAIEYGHVRNIFTARWMGHLALLTTMTVHWIVWLALADSKSFILAITDFITQPTTLWHQFLCVLQTGTWWGPGGTWSGTWLMIVWIIEAAIIYFPFIKSVSVKVRLPYSETDRAWLALKVLPPLPLISFDSIEGIKNGFESVLQSAHKIPGDGEHSLVTLFFTKEEYYITIDNKVARPGGDPRTNLRTKKVLEHWSVSEKTGHHLHQLVMGIPCYLLDESFRDNVSKKLRFSEQEVQQGIIKYNNITSDTLRNRFVWVDKVWHPRLGQVSVHDLYGKILPSRLVAMIWFIQHEPVHEQKKTLAEKLSFILSDDAAPQRAEIFTIALNWYKAETDDDIKLKLASGLTAYPASEEKKEFPELYKQTMKQRDTEFSYLCRPGYGSSQFLIEIDGADDEFFLQDFLNIIDEIHPRGKSAAGFHEMHEMLSSGNVEWEGDTDFGEISFHQDVYGTAFIHGEENDTVIKKIDSILQKNPRFTREEFDPEKYK